MANTVPPTMPTRPGTNAASLWVGNLEPTVNEALLYESFNEVGRVASIRVVRDILSRKSKGYAYVNFHNPEDAETAKDQLNHTLVKNRQIRIMKVERDSRKRTIGKGNVFVKNLDDSIDDRTLHDTFSMFGDISSSLVARDAKGKSRGYGYVHFEKEEHAQKAIEKVNGMEIAEKRVCVEAFKPKKDRPKVFNTVYVKHFPVEWIEKDLLNYFNEVDDQLKDEKEKSSKSEEDSGAKDSDSKDEKKPKEASKDSKESDKSGSGDKSEVKLQPVTCWIKEHETRNGRKGKFAFITFKNAMMAPKAVEKLHDKPLRDRPDVKLYVQPSMKQAERRRLLQQKNPRSSNRLKGIPLIVKNLPINWTSKDLREQFKQFGEVLTARVMFNTKTGTSRQFGYVNFQNESGATSAMAKMHNKTVGQGLQLEVSRAKSGGRGSGRGRGRGRGGRGRQSMQSGGMGVPMGRGGMYPQPFGGMTGAPPAQPYGMAGPQPAYPMNMNPMYAQMASQYNPPYPPQGAPARPGPYQMAPQSVPPQGPQQTFAGQTPGGYAAARPGPMSTPQRTPQTLMPQRGVPMQGYQMMQGAMQGGPVMTGAMQGGPVPPSPYGARQPMAPQAAMMTNPNVATTGAPQGVAPQSAPQTRPAAQAPAQSRPNPQELKKALMSASAPDQKRLIGEELYPLVQAVEPNRAGKVTGMLLEMDNTELLHLLEDQQALLAKIQEALTVLREHSKAEPPTA